MNINGEKVIVYHGTTSNFAESIIREVDLTMGRKKTDFGQGFYVTPKLKQAKRWARSKANAHNGNRKNIKYKNFVNPAVLSFEYDMLHPNIEQKYFSDADNEWAMFVLASRTQPGLHAYDIIGGPVADGDMAELLLDFEEGDLSPEEFCSAIMPMAHFKSDYQLSFHSKKSLNYLRFIQEVDLNGQVASGKSGEKGEVIK
ncbi:MULTISPECIES: DUF3990 domain-containing protein [Bacillaceae]|uniref:DUF3990 domain-containing protein n=1 Tax=Bacillaceae TaxID=186817 RepID=UPI00104FB395|nr:MULTISPECIES: DUF3990 domain-containing protein [Bacillaceae]TDB51747.1 DUF3990 domain-containing protein [Bacillus sp. CBEL-1]